MSQRDFVRVTYPEPHILRTRKILAAHPEIRQLFGNTPSTAFWAVAVVALQIGLAFALAQSGLGWVLLAAYTVGALATHALWVIIHDCSHNLAFKGTAANRWLAIFANLPFIFPSAVSFRKFHLIHHRHQGEMELDADLAGPMEAKIVGNSVLGKSLWLLFFPFVEGVIRPMRVRSVKIWDTWTVVNVAVELAFLALVYWAAGPMALAYLALSSLFSVGLHPVGARWIQEHYIFREGQETYSYYGILNKTCFNVGYHNEHHDLMMVPWSRLPQVRAMAPEFYDNLYWHESWTKLLFRFLFDPKLDLYSRAVRPSRRADQKKAEEFKGESTEQLAPVSFPVEATT